MCKCIAMHESLASSVLLQPRSVYFGGISDHSVVQNPPGIIGSAGSPRLKQRDHNINSGPSFVQMRTNAI